ncbi:PLP-dependent aminotransferase family protein [Streptomyces subrutilus]|uniref:aminotransferase-like domain-containing protein n=1 Tax=Streptomyces subrutilus TaxID=36818 RepID=UPI0033C9D834
MQLDLSGAPSGGRTAWLAARLRAAIADGTLPVGSRLPASRVLAAELRVSRGLVTEAYQRLAESGQVSGRGRAGTVVVAAPAPTPAPVPVPPRGGLVDALRAVPCRIDLSPGVPDLTAFPRTAWLQAERRVLAGLTPADFGYGQPQGAPALRSAVAGWLARNRGIRADPDEVVIVAGVAQALGLLARVARERGVHRVAVEDPGSLGARQQLAYERMEVVPVPVDGAGLDVAALRASGAGAVLLTPAHQFPTGVVLDGERRRDLLGWATAGGLVIEDDYDAEHRYDRAPVDPTPWQLRKHQVSARKSPARQVPNGALSLSVRALRAVQHVLWGRARPELHGVRGARVEGRSGAAVALYPADGDRGAGQFVAFDAERDVSREDFREQFIGGHADTPAAANADAGNGAPSYV